MHGWGGQWGSQRRSTAHWLPAGLPARVAAAAARAISAIYALAAEGVGAARPGACGSLSPPRATRTAPKAWELRARALLHVAPPPPLMRALPLGCGDVEDVVRFTLLETLVARRASRSCRGRGWGGVVQTSSCASVRGNACVLPPHVQCASARSAAGIGAPSPQARPTLSARARRGRRVRVQTAARRTFGGGGARTNSELPQAGFPCSGEVSLQVAATSLLSFR